jgi:hypothetical protein
VYLSGTPRKRRRLGQLDPLNTVPAAAWLAAQFASNDEPIWSEQAYVPGAVNADPSVNFNPNPTVEGTIADLVNVWNDPWGDDNSATPPASGISAWLLIPAALVAVWLVLK